MSRQRYLTSARVESIRSRLAARDWAMVGTLDTIRLATTAQLGRLHVTGGSASSNLRQTQAALARLAGLRVVTALPRQVGGVRAGSAGTVWALDLVGQHLASACGPAGGRRLRRPWTPSLAFVAHTVAISELLVRLTETARSAPLEVLDFQGEPRCWRAFTGLGGARTWLKPDAFVRVGLGEYEDSYFIEVDRGTASLTAVDRKLTTYGRYFQTGREQHHRGVFPKVLLLAADADRTAALAQLAASAARPELFAALEYEHAVQAICEEAS